MIQHSSQDMIQRNAAMRAVMPRGKVKGTLLNMKIRTSTIAVWSIALALLALNLAVFYQIIYLPGIEVLEFTNFDAIRWINHLPFVNLSEPTQSVQYTAFHIKWVGLLSFWPLLIIPAHHTLCDFPIWQRIVSTFLRTALLAFIVLALIDIEKTDETHRTSIVYAVDVSPSVPDDMLLAAHAEVSEALRQRSPEVNVQIITYAHRPQLMEIPENGELPMFARMAAEPGEIQGTDIESALRYSYALFPENAVRRIVLLGDGNQTQGDVLAEAARAREQGIRIDVKHLAAVPTHEIMLQSLDIRERDNLRVGKPFEITAEISASQAAHVTLAFEKNGERDAKNTKEIDLEPGQNFVTLTAAADAPGEMTVKVLLEGIQPEDDRFAENNSILDKLMIQGKPKILYIEQNAANASYLQRALAGYGSSSGQDFEVEVRTAAGLPTSMKEIIKYSAVILGDVPRETNTGRINVTSENMNLVRDYVKRQGGGFIAIGGDQAFGPGGYENTVIENILPVKFKNDTPDGKPSSVIALLIDKSGSMELNRNLELAKEAAKASVSVLKPQDRVLVIGFDDAPYTVVPMTRAVNQFNINSKISRMAPNGGTNIRDALEMAYLEMTMVTAKTKHVILLTDGRSPYSGIDALVREMARARITVSTIALANADTTLLSRIANLGKGRAYVARDASSVPRLFVEETNRVTAQSVIETPFVPKVARNSDMIKGVSFQTLLGYVATKAKPGAQTILTGPNSAPILAHWSLGSGKTTVFTSDAKNRWASSWIRQSGSFAKFWAQVVRATMKTDEETRFDMRVSRESGRARVIVDAIGDNDAFLNGLTVTAEIVRPDGTKTALDLPQTAPGFYENTLPLDNYGTYQARAELLNGSESIGYAQKTFTMPYALEFAHPETNSALIEAVAETSGGKIDAPFSVTADPEGVKLRTFTPMFYYFLFMALAALLLDILFRRVRMAR